MTSQKQNKLIRNIDKVKESFRDIQKDIEYLNETIDSIEKSKYSDQCALSNFEFLIHTFAENISKLKRLRLVRDQEKETDTALKVICDIEEILSEFKYSLTRDESDSDSFESAETSGDSQTEEYQVSDKEEIYSDSDYLSRLQRDGRMGEI